MKIEIIEEVDSTQRVLKKLVQEKKTENLHFILALNQTSGVGRYGRVWESQKGESFTLSFTLTKSDVPAQNELIFFIVLVLFFTLKNNFKVLGQIKWPNDLYLNEKKLAGILVELMEDYYIIGVGVNLNQPFIKDFTENKATSLFSVTGKYTSPSEFLNLFIKELTENITLWQNRVLNPIKEVQKILLYKGKKVHFIKEDGEVREGILQGVKEGSGALVILMGNTQEEFYAGTLRKV